MGVPARVLMTVDEYLEDTKAKSLRCGHLNGLEKERALKKIFGVNTTASILNRWLERKDRESAASPVARRPHGDEYGRD